MRRVLGWLAWFFFCYRPAKRKRGQDSTGVVPRDRVGESAVGYVVQRAAAVDLGRAITGSEDVARLLAPMVAAADREFFFCLSLTTKGHLSAVDVVHVGSLSSALVHPREVFRTALQAGASRIVVAHNHPSGDPTPSPEDVEISKRLVAGGELLGIRVLDSVVVGRFGAWQSALLDAGGVLPGGGVFPGGGSRVREGSGAVYSLGRLLSRENPKALKTERVTGHRVVMLYLAPAMLSGQEVCPGRSPGCTFGCINKSGHGVSEFVQAARIVRTRFYFEDRAGFMRQLDREITKEKRLAARDGVRIAFRLNGTSDLDWREVFEAWPRTRFYDHTKVWDRFEAYMRGGRPANEHLTWSRSGTPENDAHCLEVLRRGFSVAVVGDVPAGWRKLSKTGRVIDGDRHDLRFRDPRGSIIQLRPKGLARDPKAVRAGFVVRLDPVAAAVR